MTTRGTANRYWALRHGQSTANTEGVIVSRPSRRALVECGLTGRGQAEARRTAERHRPGGPVLVVTSDFARARQTAAIVTASWGLPDARVDARLRERDFGPLDGADVAAYDRVWAADVAGGTLAGVEPVEDVLARVVALVDDLDAGLSGHDVVLAAHGDVLQIAQTWFAGVPAATHRSLPHLANAELRALGPRPQTAVRPV